MSEIKTRLAPGVGWPGRPVPRVIKRPKPSGERGRTPALTKEQIQQCLDSTAPAWVLAELFGVHPATVSRARRKVRRDPGVTSLSSAQWIPRQSKP